MTQEVKLLIRMFRSIEGEPMPCAKIIAYCPDGSAIEAYPPIYFAKFPEDTNDWLHMAEQCIEILIRRWEKNENGSKTS